MLAALAPTGKPPAPASTAKIILARDPKQRWGEHVLTKLFDKNELSQGFSRSPQDLTRTSRRCSIKNLQENVARSSYVQEPWRGSCKIFAREPPTASHKSSRSSTSYRILQDIFMTLGLCKAFWNGPLEAFHTIQNSNQHCATTRAIQHPLNTKKVARPYHIPRVTEDETWKCEQSIWSCGHFFTITAPAMKSRLEANEAPHLPRKRITRYQSQKSFQAWPGSASQNVWNAQLFFRPMSDMLWMHKVKTIASDASRLQTWMFQEVVEETGRPSCFQRGELWSEFAKNKGAACGHNSATGRLKRPTSQPKRRPGRAELRRAR